MSFAFSQVDVFTESALRGNPLAVVHGADGLSDEQMQTFARWTNLSETTFLSRPTSPEADYRVRIFTPGGELPFAGHPTLGSCHAWLENGGKPKTAGRVIQECAKGLVPIRLDGTRTAFAAPSSTREAVDPQLLAQVLAALKVPAAKVKAVSWLDNGPKWLGLVLEDAQSVLDIEPDHSLLKNLAKVGVIAPHASGDVQFEVRAFAASIGIPEDPVTGSLNASFAQWLIGEGMAPERYLAAQGTCMDRRGRVHVQREGDTVWIGGQTVTVIRGELNW
jgi:PhzF family phenazine biosynthesis protein